MPSEKPLSGRCPKHSRILLCRPGVKAESNKSRLANLFHKMVKGQSRTTIRTKVGKAPIHNALYQDSAQRCLGYGKEESRMVMYGYGGHLESKEPDHLNKFSIPF